jgi:mRNA-degrading endonuclease toxin of MazEF toxin-antitoxin module
MKACQKTCVLAADQIDVADKLSLTSQIVTLGDEKMTELAKALDPIPSEGLILNTIDERLDDPR